ncbi:MAG: hypothetical protein P1P63_02515 [Treponemataceae bacterium]
MHKKAPSKNIFYKRDTIIQVAQDPNEQFPFEQELLEHSPFEQPLEHCVQESPEQKKQEIVFPPLKVNESIL